MRLGLLATLLVLVLPASAGAARLSVRHAEHAIRTAEPGATVSGCVRLSAKSVECRATAPEGTLYQWPGEGGTEEWLLEAVLSRGHVNVALGGERLQLRSG